MSAKDWQSADNGAGQGLRREAEEIARADAAQSAESLETFSPEAMRQMVHELRVHQIELEMQNEELRQAQVELDVSRARYFDLYDLAPVGYCSINESGLVLQANLNAAALLGVARGELVRQPISRFIFREDQDIYYRFRKQLLESGEPQWCDLQLLKSDGTFFWAQLAATVAHEADGEPLLCIVMNDISERKRVEAERAYFDQLLQVKNSELENARQVADKANRAKSDFLSSMSHELRTPLSAILGFAQLIESGSTPPTPSQQRSIEQILKAGWYLLELINEILDLALIESGKLSLSIEPVSLPEVLLECQTMIEAQAQQHAIQVVFPQFENPCFIKADRMRVKQVLINLLSNAIKYNRVGGSVVVECTAQHADTLRISVRDTGAGLDPERIAQLFQPFNRLGQNAGTEEGTGIGLVVSKRLIELMGGVIGVDSTVGTGSVFWIELNLTAEVQTASAASAARGQTGVPLHTLLYVEDNPANLLLVEDIIARWPDIRFLSAQNSIDGIKLARSSRPDVILMDINLPGISGLEAMKILAKDPETAHIPVVALSANAMPHDIQKGLEAGFFRYLTKPIMVNEFLETMDVAFKYAKAAAARAGSESDNSEPAH